MSVGRLTLDMFVNGKLQTMHFKGFLNTIKAGFNPLHTEKRVGRKVFLLSLVVSILLSSCGTDSHHFEIEGHFLKMNQGEFYVYSPDNAIHGVDTIRVQGGRFTYEIPCEGEGTLVIVLPNFSELPVFVEPGSSVTMDADASHIKDIKIEGTDANDAMTKWRESIDNMSPPEQCKQAERFITDNPTSIVSRWLLRKYFVLSATPDLVKARKLLGIMMKADEKNLVLMRLSQGLGRCGSLDKGKALPAFSAVDIDGNIVSSADYKSGTAVIIAMASWNYDGTNLCRMVRSSCEKYKTAGKTQPHVLCVSLDPSKSSIPQTFTHEDFGWPVVCDGKMWDSPLVKSLGINNIPDNLIVRNGKIVGRGMRNDDLIRELEKDL